ncbi:hypothetical protein NDU88_004935, partial [Pleurodeles waltl]
PMRSDTMLYKIDPGWLYRAIAQSRGSTEQPTLDHCNVDWYLMGGKPMDTGEDAVMQGELGNSRRVEQRSVSWNVPQPRRLLLHIELVGSAYPITAAPPPAVAMLQSREAGQRGARPGTAHTADDA